MPKFYIKFGAKHNHNINGQELDRTYLYCIDAKNKEKARERAYELFKDQYFSEYHEKELPNIINFHPNGIIYDK